MEPSYSHSDLKAMFYEWFYISFSEKFKELMPFEKEAICETNFQRLLQAGNMGISERQFPELVKK